MAPEDDDLSWHCCRYWHRKLHNKWNSRLFAGKRGCPVPTIYWHGGSPRNIPFTDLPKRYVLKPIFDSAACRNVYLMDGGFERMRDRTYSTEELVHELTGNMSWRNTHRERRPLMIQEYASPAPGEPGISREYKVHMFADRVAAIVDVRRLNQTKSTVTYYTEDWKMIKERMNAGRSGDEHLEYHPPAACLDDLLARAKRIGSALGTYVRLDFLISETGFFFGEMTFTPGVKVTPYADEYYERFWNETCQGTF